MGQARENAPSAEHRLCGCGEYWIGPDAPHRVNGDLAIVDWQVMGAPKYGREAHTVRECYREVCADRSWAEALESWKRDLAAYEPTQAPMPVGHIMFDALPGSASLSRRDNAAREQANA